MHLHILAVADSNHCFGQI